MTYRVVILPSAEDDIVEAAASMSQQSSISSAADWVVSIQTAINTLSQLPFRCPLAPENESFREQIRQLLDGKGRRQYRILYTVRDDAVYILHVRHAARPYLEPDKD